MKTVTVPAGWAGRSIPETTVQLDGEQVLLDGQPIGYVWKGTRTYSPPVSRGSRIVRYHKKVAEWHAGPHRGSMPRHRADTRQDVLRRLIADHQANQA